jgi:hypothetical protein
MVLVLLALGRDHGESFEVSIPSVRCALWIIDIVSRRGRLHADTDILHRNTPT